MLPCCRLQCCNLIMLQSCNAAYCASVTPISRCAVCCMARVRRRASFVTRYAACCSMLHAVCSTLHVARCMLHVVCCTIVGCTRFHVVHTCVRRGADLRTAASVEPTSAAHRTLCVRLGFVSAPLRLPPVFLSLSSQCVPNGPLSIYLWR
jgi:hypothetical protein